MNSEQFDLVIIGAGPAGSSAAIRLALAGRKVMLVEKTKFPRQKLCGEFVSPECLRHFHELGVDADINDLNAPKIKNTAFYSVNGRSVSVPNSLLDTNGSYSIGLSRAMLDDILMNRAVQAGVDVRTETSLRRPLIVNGRLAAVELAPKNGSPYAIETPLAMDATGRSRVLARFFDRSPSKKPGLVAFKTHLHDAAIENQTCEIYSYPSGYGGCTEIESGLYNLCFITSGRAVMSIGNERKQFMLQLVMQNPRARKVLDSSDLTGEWHAVPIAKFGRENVVPFPGVIAIGDAAAFIDPFTGSGIALALASAKLAADAIAPVSSFEKVAGVYERSYRSSFDNRFRVCRMLRLASSAPWIASATIAALGHSSYLTKVFARATRGYEAEGAP